MLGVDYATLALTGDADLDLLDDAERARARRYVDAGARHRFVLARGALRRELAHRLGVAAHAIAFASGPQGKPRLAAPLDASGITFSISHSGDLALFAFARRVEIGADVERIRRLRFGPEIARRVLGAEDLAEEAFFRAWVRREAVVKCAGGSILAPVEPPPTHAIADVPVPAGYAAAICAASSALTLVERPLYSAG